MFIIKGILSMSDFYEAMLKHNAGRKVLKSIGLPTPVELKRFDGEAAFFERKILVGASNHATCLNALANTLVEANAEIFIPDNIPTASDIAAALEKAGHKTNPACCDRKHCSSLRTMSDRRLGRYNLN